MNRIGLHIAGELIDFTGNAHRGNGRSPERRSDISSTLARSQLEGSVAAYNMLARNHVAYIADEVGLGKTYVALGVMGLVRHFRPNARILVLAPKENIQKKWVRDFGNFVRNNWRVIDNRVKSVQGEPTRKPVVCGSLTDFARNVSINANRDFFLRMTSFSLALKHPESRNRYREQILSYVGWLHSELRAEEAGEFREQYGRALNALLPDIDLLVVDEAHNLRKGFGTPGDRYVSNRNRVLGLMLGHPQAGNDGHPHYQPRAKRVLCLSATPFEADYHDLWQQLDVLGKGHACVREADGNGALSMKSLANTGIDDEARRTLARNLLIRRITHLNIGGEDHTKNMYRREWRHGGFERPDQPIRFEDARQRLAVALVQKKVAEVLGDKRFGNQFQIGMLSSFESFLQSVGNIRKKQLAEANGAEAEEADEATTFDGQQTHDPEEQRGADTQALNALIESYREHFRSEIPHPKLDATVKALADAFRTGEKALIFVRRVATVAELARRLDRKFDEWIERRMKDQLPGLSPEIDKLFERFREETRAGMDHTPNASEDESEADGIVAIQPGVDDDPGGRENFFSWFFRGKGPEGVLSGAAFQKNRLSNPSAAYSTLFEDDLVSWLLDRPGDPLECLARHLRLTSRNLEDKLRQLAWAYYRREHEGQTGRYPRYYVFEAYQAAALHLIGESSDTLAKKASEVLRLRFPEHHGESASPPPGFPLPNSAIGVSTFFTELVRNERLRQELWPKGEGTDFTESFRRREQRRELLSAMARLGGAYIDLYLLAIQQFEGFEGERDTLGDKRARRELAPSFVELLAQQRQRPGDFHAYAELSGAAMAFDTLIKVNFPEAPTADLGKLAELFGRGLQEQNPVGRMAGSVAGRTVRQFRMPGFPLVLISTDVLQEGEDLHTFCRRVIHYGVTWTPSAMEQRTGRVDRIGGLAQRTLDGKCSPAEPQEKIQVFYPHLQDTVERLQVRRVLERLDTFLRLVHVAPLKHLSHDPKLDMNREVLSATDIPPPVKEKLESAFPVRSGWLNGATDHALVHRVDVPELRDLLEEHWNRLLQGEGIEQPGKDGPFARHGVLRVRGHRIALAKEPEASGTVEDLGVRLQRVHLELRSSGVADVTFLRCSSAIGHVDLKNQPEHFDQLMRLQARLGQPRLCARWDAKHGSFALSIEASLPFDRATTQYEEVHDLVCRIALQADRIEETLLGEDKDARTPAGMHAVDQSRAMQVPTPAPRDVGKTTARRPHHLDRVRELLGRHDAIEWSTDGPEIVVAMTCSDLDESDAPNTSGRTIARKQRVRISRKGNEYVFTTTVLGATAEGHDLALRAWSRNAETELVNFALDPKDRLVGEIPHPVGHLDEGELLIYLHALATEGDRFEYVLSGRDEY